MAEELYSYSQPVACLRVRGGRVPPLHKWPLSGVEIQLLNVSNWPSAEIDITSGLPTVGNWRKFGAGSFMALYWLAVPGHKLPVRLATQFSYVRHRQSRLNVGITGSKLTSTLPRPGHSLPATD
jgi:hypothetical protein